MKTIMNKLTTVKSMLVLVLVLLIALGTVLADDPVMPIKEPTPLLTGTTEYLFVGDLGVVVDGRWLVWEGTISGDINGIIQWWVGEVTETGGVIHYDDRWVILDQDNRGMLLMGDESGSTTARDGKDSIWRTNGVVIDAGEGWRDWIGRQAHADGNEEMLEIETPDGPILILGGTGTFRVN